MKKTAKHLIVVSNRLPYVIEGRGAKCVLRPASGGLVTALAPALRKRGGIWIGWSGRAAEDPADVAGLLERESAGFGYSVKAVALTAAERDLFYFGFANEVIWPLFHCLDERCNFDPKYWQTYKHVNRKFADAAREGLADGGNHYAWVHDYHLMLVGDELRRQGVRSRIGFFLHTPFPPPDIFLKLPWRFELLRGLLAYDTIGFQTARDRRNFVQCVRTLLRDASAHGRGRMQTVTTPTRRAQVGTFPISIDFREFADEAAGEETCQKVARIRSELPKRTIILGVDRLDYTKGIPAKLKAFRTFLRDRPEFHRKVTLVQFVVPSREGISAYQALKEEIDELVGEINGEYTKPGWVPVHYSFRSLPRSELLAFYRVASVALVTPLNDGMNLVAKEYCAANTEETGVLILSEFAGAAAELQRGALLVNPYDVEGLAATLHEALTMETEERRRRMRRLRQAVRQRDINRWLNDFLQAASGSELADSPQDARFVPAEQSVNDVTLGQAGAGRVENAMDSPLLVERRRDIAPAALKSPRGARSDGARAGT